jgi:drug/metabolite transporter (DMT)-like permease
VAVLLALITAASYGVGDFSGGLAARRAAPLTVTATAHALGLVSLTFLAAVVGAELVRPADLVIGALAGACGCLGIVLLYRGLAGGRMAIISPITAVVAAVVPVVGGLISGERPGALAVVGIFAAIAAIALVSRSGPMGRPDRESLLIALGSGIGFGTYFLLISGVHEEAGLWPLVVGRLTSVFTAVTLALFRGLPPIVGRVALPLTLAAGILDVTANVTFLLATQRGLLSIVAVIASLYPAGTVLLAMAVEGERLSPAQGIGLVAAAGALVLIAL